MAIIVDPGVPSVIVHGAVSTAPAINTVLVTTGNLRRGVYYVRAHVMAEEANQFALEHRNAADAANIEEMRIDNTGDFVQQIEGWFDLGAAGNESMRVINLVAGAATIDYQASIFMWLLWARDV